MLGGEFCASRGPHLVSNCIDQSLNVVLIAIVDYAIMVLQTLQGFHFILEDDLRPAPDELIPVLQGKMHLLDGDIGLIGLRVLPEELQLRCPGVFLSPLNVLLDEVVQNFLV